MEIFVTSDVLADIEAIETEEIDLADITESGTIEVKLDLPDGVQASEDFIEVHIEIEAEETFDNVPINFDHLENGHDLLFLLPSDPFMKVTIIGKDKDISQLTADDFQLSINLEGLGEGEHRVPVSIEGPDNVKASTEYEEVEIEITNKLE